MLLLSLITKHKPAGEFAPFTLFHPSCRHQAILPYTFGPQHMYQDFGDIVQNFDMNATGVGLF